MESMIIVSTIAQHYRMRLDPDHPVEGHALVTLRPRYGIMASLAAR